MTANTRDGAPVVRCGRCGRRLKNPVYIEAGFGRTCAAKPGIVIPQKRKTAPADTAAPDGEGR